MGEYQFTKYEGDTAAAVIAAGRILDRVLQQERGDHPLAQRPRDAHNRCVNVRTPEEDVILVRDIGSSSVAVMARVQQGGLWWEPGSLTYKRIDGPQTRTAQYVYVETASNVGATYKRFAGNVSSETKRLIVPDDLADEAVRGLFIHAAGRVAYSRGYSDPDVPCIEPGAAASELEVVRAKLLAIRAELAA